MKKLRDLSLASDQFKTLLKKYAPHLLLAMHPPSSSSSSSPTTMEDAAFLPPDVR